MLEVTEGECSLSGDRLKSQIRVNSRERCVRGRENRVDIGRAVSAAGSLFSCNAIGLAHLRDNCRGMVLFAIRISKSIQHPC